MGAQKPPEVLRLILICLLFIHRIGDAGGQTVRSDGEASRRKRTTAHAAAGAQNGRDRLPIPGDRVRRPFVSQPVVDALGGSALVFVLLCRLAKQVP